MSGSYLRRMKLVNPNVAPYATFCQQGFTRRVACGATSAKNCGMKLGEALKGTRKEAGLTLDDLAEKAGTTKSSVSRIESGDQAPSLDMLERLAAALGVMVYQIFARAEGAKLPVGKATPEERALLNEIKAMEPEVREHYMAIARGLVKK